MNFLRRYLLRAIVVMALCTASNVGQPSPDYTRDPFAIRLRSAVQAKYPGAKMGIAGRYVKEFLMLRLEIDNITPPDIMGRPIAAAPSTSEEIARTFLSNFSRELELNTDLLELHSTRTLDWGKRGNTYRVSLRPCYHGIPVFRSMVDVEVRNDQILVNGYNPVPEGEIHIESPIPADSAVASLEWAERTRFYGDAPPRRIFGYGIISQILYSDYFDVRDSTGRWIPFEERFLGCELVIFPQITGMQVIPKFAWRMYLGSGEDIMKIPYVEAIVDARNGEVLDLTPLGGGCVIVGWARTPCTRK